jgi:hypothetical protein
MPGTILAVVLLGWFTATGVARILFAAKRAADVNATAAFLEKACTEPLPIAVAYPHTFLQQLQYAPPPLAGRLVSLNNADAAMRAIGHDTDEKALRGLRDFAPLKVRAPDYAAFTSTNPRFYVFGDYPWLGETLKADGARLDEVARHGDTPLFLATIEKRAAK